MFDDELSQGLTQVNPSDAFLPRETPDYSYLISKLLGRTSVMDDVPNNMRPGPAAETVSSSLSLPSAGNELSGTRFVTDSLPDYLRPNPAAAATAPRALTVPVKTEKTPLDNVLGDMRDAWIDTRAGLYQMGPALLQNVSDIVRMATDDEYGKNSSEYWKLRRKASREHYGTPMLNEQRKGLEEIMADPDKTIYDMGSYVWNHPRVALETVLADGGAEFLLSRVGGGLTKSIAKGRGAGPRAIATAGKAGEIVTDAVSNAGNTYSSKELENLPSSDRYKATGVSGLMSLLIGTAADRAKGDEARRSAAGLLKAFGADRIQDGLHEYGKVIAESAAHDQMPDLNNLGKRMVFSGALGSPS